MKKYSHEEINQHYQAFIDGDCASSIVIEKIVSQVIRKVFSDVVHSFDIDDVIQEVFIKILRGKKYNPEKGNFFTYVIMCAKTTRVDLFRRQSVFSRHLPNIAEKIRATKTSTLQLDDIVRKERSLLLRDCLLTVCPETVECMVLQFGHSQTLESISISTKRPLGTVKSKTNRGRKFIESKLKEVIQ
jgi:RNA polymerase sigma factor (sigma-70 family)